MNEEQLKRVGEGRGFIAALDQSGGSTPNALRAYGIPESSYSTEEEMFSLMHEMRSRIFTSPSFTGERIFGAILFEETLGRDVEGRPPSSYLWSQKTVVPFLKVDKGLAASDGGVALMKDIPALEATLEVARDAGVFGTKMRSVIKGADAAGVEAVVDQQFEIARRILASGLVPILEPEVDIGCADKAKAEALLKSGILRSLESLSGTEQVMVKITIPEEDDFYLDLVNHPKVLRVVALSGGYSQAEAVARLARNHGVSASFSRALTEGLSVDLDDAQFDAVLRASIDEIYEASIT